MPACRLAEPTEVKTRCTPAALAASAADMPCRVSAWVPPSNGVVIAKREVAPSSAFVSAAVSSSDARRSVTPAFASSLAFAESRGRGAAPLPGGGGGFPHGALFFPWCPRDGGGRLPPPSPFLFPGATPGVVG